MICWVAGPFDKILTSTTRAPCVYKSFYMVMEFVVDDVRWRWISNGCGVVAGEGFEMGDVDDRVTSAVLGQVKFVDDVRSGFQHFVGSIEFGVEFAFSSGC